MKTVKKSIKKNNHSAKNNRLKNRNSQLTDNKTNKAFAVLAIAFLIFQFGNGLFLPQPSVASVAENLCPVDLDAVLIIDTSGSMNDISKCDWWQLKCVDSPECTSYEWVQNTT